MQLRNIGVQLFGGNSLDRIEQRQSGDKKRGRREGEREKEAWPFQEINDISLIGSYIQCPRENGASL